MGGPIELKISEGILGTTGLPARGLLEMCMIHFKEYAKWEYNLNKKSWQYSILTFNPHL